jgi:hypothetical protein
MSAEGLGTQEMPSSQKNERLAQIHRDIVYVAQHVHDPAFSFAETGMDNSGHQEMAIVDVSGPDVSLRWFVDPQSGKIVRETYKAMGQAGLVDTETDFSDWKNVEGLSLPFHRENKQGGESASSLQYSSIELNPAVDPKIFEKPAAPAQ